MRKPPDPDIVPPDLPQRRTERPAWIPAIQPGCTTQERHYRLITPLFGGGVEPGADDPVTTIRGPEVRGQLRFWWRATRGGHYPMLPDLHQAEAQLWGSVHGGSPRSSLVQIALTLTAPGQEEHPFEVIPGKPDKYGRPRPRIEHQVNVAPPYAAFPLQPEQRNTVIGMHTKTVQVGVAFTLALTYPQHWPGTMADDFAGSTPAEEVAAALWAWESFGGLGGRTRRGFGALHCLEPIADLPETPADAAQWVKERLARNAPSPAYICAGVAPAGVPSLGGVVRHKLLGRGVAQQVWRDLIERLRQFRQARTKGNMGRSLWPEADAIRRMTGRRQYDDMSTLNRFPRAAFGLPIIFHFKDANDPSDTSLQGAERQHDRLASRLILRPLACRNGQVVGLALVLNGPDKPPGGVILKGAPRHPLVVTDLAPQEAAMVDSLKGQTDVLDAFLATL